MHQAHNVTAIPGDAFFGKHEARAFQEFGGGRTPPNGNQRKQQASCRGIVSRLGDRLVDRLVRLLPMVDGFLLSLEVQLQKA